MSRMLADMISMLSSTLPVTTGPWTDVGATTAEPIGIRKPINIKRVACHPLLLTASDTLEVTIHWENGSHEKPPPFAIERTIRVDSVTKFEVIDEFGLDCGIGFVLGQSKQ